MLLVLLQAIGRALYMAAAMGWKMLWALILGFAVSGVIQAVVSRKEMGRLLPDARAGTIVKAAALGAAASSCSYAATAIARSIVKQGGDFTAAMAFQFASTRSTWTARCSTPLSRCYSLLRDYGVEISGGQVALMLLMLLAASKGVGAVPRAVRVVVTATLPVFHIPAAGVALLIGVDHLLDMGRGATDVLGNHVAACVVDRYEPPPGRSS